MRQLLGASFLITKIMEKETEERFRRLGFGDLADLFLTLDLDCKKNETDRQQEVRLLENQTRRINSRLRELNSNQTTYEKAN
ncbi:MAG: hypothetical protein PHG83_02475 [Patescibacteria group bacterium]|nr:hypothetical protein [Patescibacteria group bacterium]